MRKLVGKLFLIVMILIHLVHTAAKIRVLLESFAVRESLLTDSRESIGSQNEKYVVGQLSVSC